MTPRRRVRDDEGLTVQERVGLKELYRHSMTVTDLILLRAAFTLDMENVDGRTRSGRRTVAFARERVAVIDEVLAAAGVVRLA